MAEKVIGEVRFIETEDGFRIEVKGDKERLRELGFEPGKGFRHGMGFGPMGFRFRGHHHGPWGRRFGFGFRRGWGCGPWGWYEEPEEEPQREGKGEPPSPQV
jgi:hypothetical protein